LELDVWCCHLQSLLPFFRNLFHTSSRRIMKEKNLHYLFLKTIIIILEQLWQNLYFFLVLPNFSEKKLFYVTNSIKR
jgi:hypothetical protein